MILILLILGLAACQATMAQDVDVISAEPSAAEQGTKNLDVVISGNGFDNSAVAYFWKTGTTEPAGISVHDTKTRGPKKVIATISIADTAEVADFDIEIRMSRNRGGKGTTLFKVQTKTTGSGTSELSANFCLFLENFDPGLAPDSEDVYCDSKKNKVKVGTGSGPGFRFDTNTAKHTPTRTVTINVPAGSADIYNDLGDFLTTFSTGDYDIDLRFNKTDSDAGLDLGAMLIDEVNYVPVDMSINPLGGGDPFGMAWGNEESTPFDHGHLRDSPCYTTDARVVRKTAGTWTVESDPLDDHRACLWVIDGAVDEQKIGTIVNMPFKFTIEIK